MKKKTEQVNGKGDKSRVTNKKKFDKNWEKIFGKGKITGSLSHESKKTIRLVYSNDVCKIDEGGGPYEIDVSKLDNNNK